MKTQLITKELHDLVDKNRKSCCLHSLSYKCKEWTTQYRLMLISHFGSSCSYIEVKDIDTNKIIYSLHGTEPEAVFKATQWILENKDNK